MGRLMYSVSREVKVTGTCIELSGRSASSMKQLASAFLTSAGRSGVQDGGRPPMLAASKCPDKERVAKQHLVRERPKNSKVWPLPALKPKKAQRRRSHFI